MEWPPRCPSGPKLVRPVGILDAGRRCDEHDLAGVPGGLLLYGIDQFPGSGGRIGPCSAVGSTQMEKNSAPRLPWWMESRLRLPPPSGSARSKCSSTKRCGVSAWVSMTSAERWTHFGALRLGRHFVDGVAGVSAQASAGKGEEQEGEQGTGMHRLGVSVYLTDSAYGKVNLGIPSLSHERREAASYPFGMLLPRIGLRLVPPIPIPTLSPE